MDRSEALLVESMLQRAKPSGAMPRLHKLVAPTMLALDGSSDAGMAAVREFIAWWDDRQVPMSSGRSADGVVWFLTYGDEGMAAMREWFKSRLAAPAQ